MVRSPERVEGAVRLLAETQQHFLGGWHWLSFHAATLPLTAFMSSLLKTCTKLERISPEAPKQMMAELAQLGGRERDESHYEQILQKLAEILVANQVVQMPWPKGTTYKIEESAPGSQKSVDLVVTHPDGSRVGFEVKAPELLKHGRRRADRAVAVPLRGPNGMLDAVSEVFGDPALPRDNTVRSFLRSAEAKFAPFKQAGQFTGILVIVWDDHPYEVIGHLVHEQVGLLTQNSYSRVGEAPEQYPSVDAVIVVRHLTYFVEALAERPLPDGRDHAFHVGGHSGVPNVLIPAHGQTPIPQFVADGFNALPREHPLIAHAAEYQPNELVMWMEI